MNSGLYYALQKVASRGLENQDAAEYAAYDDGAGFDDHEAPVAHRKIQDVGYDEQAAVAQRQLEWQQEQQLYNNPVILGIKGLVNKARNLVNNAAGSANAYVNNLQNYWQTRVAPAASRIADKSRAQAAAQQQAGMMEEDQAAVDYAAATDTQQQPVSMVEEDQAAADHAAATDTQQQQPQQQPPQQPRQKQPTLFDDFNTWTNDNPTAWNVIKYGGGAFLLSSLLSSLFGAKNPMAWSLLPAAAAAGYGLYKSDWFKRNQPRATQQNPKEDPVYNQARFINMINGFPSWYFPPAVPRGNVPEAVARELVPRNYQPVDQQFYRQAIPEWRSIVANNK